MVVVLSSKAGFFGLEEEEDDLLDMVTSFGSVEVAVPELPTKMPLAPIFEYLEENVFLCDSTSSRESKTIRCMCMPSEEELRTGRGCGENCLNRQLFMECGSRCPSGKFCTNKQFQRRQYADLEIFPAGLKGWGLRAKSDIARGQFIIEYVGEVVDGYEKARRIRRYGKDPRHKHHYFMALRNDAVIDATVRGNLSRFINHSCDPNAVTQKWSVNRQLRIGFFALRSIAAGEEIVFNYQFERYGRKSQPCFCGSSNCSGFIGGRKEEEVEDDDEAEDEEDGSSYASTSSESESEVEETPPPPPPPNNAKRTRVAKAKAVELLTISTTAEKQSTKVVKVERAAKAEKTLVSKSSKKEKKKAESIVNVESQRMNKEKRHRRHSEKKAKRLEVEEEKKKALELVEVSEMLDRGLPQNKEHIVEFNRLMVRVDQAESRQKMIEFLLKISDSEILRLFVQNQGLGLLRIWFVMPDVAESKTLKMRNNIVRLLLRLPIESRQQIDESNILPNLQYVQSRASKLSNEAIVEDVLMDMVYKVSMADTPVELNRRPDSLIIEHGNLQLNVRKLLEKWKRLHEIGENVVESKDDNDNVTDMVLGSDDEAGEEEEPPVASATASAHYRQYMMVATSRSRHQNDKFRGFNHLERRTSHSSINRAINRERHNESSQTRTHRGHYCDYRDYKSNLVYYAREKRNYHFGSNNYNRRNNSHEHRSHAHSNNEDRKELRRRTSHDDYKSTTKHSSSAMPLARCVKSNKEDKHERRQISDNANVNEARENNVAPKKQKDSEKKKREDCIAKKIEHSDRSSNADLLLVRLSRIKDKIEEKIKTKSIGVTDLTSTGKLSTANNSFPRFVGFGAPALTTQAITGGAVGNAAPVSVLPPPGLIFPMLTPPPPVVMFPPPPPPHILIGMASASASMSANSHSSASQSNFFPPPPPPPPPLVQNVKSETGDDVCNVPLPVSSNEPRPIEIRKEKKPRESKWDKPPINKRSTEWKEIVLAGQHISGPPRPPKLQQEHLETSRTLSKYIGSLHEYAGSLNTYISSLVEYSVRKFGKSSANDSAPKAVKEKPTKTKVNFTLKRKWLNSFTENNSIADDFVSGKSQSPDETTTTTTTITRMANGDELDMKLDDIALPQELSTKRRRIDAAGSASSGGETTTPPEDPLIDNPSTTMIAKNNNNKDDDGASGRVAATTNSSTMIEPASIKKEQLSPQRPAVRKWSIVDSLNSINNCTLSSKDLLEQFDNSTALIEFTQRSQLQNGAGTAAPVQKPAACPTSASTATTKNTTATTVESFSSSTDPIITTTTTTTTITFSTSINSTIVSSTTALTTTTTTTTAAVAISSTTSEMTSAAASKSGVRKVVSKSGNWAEARDSDGSIYYFHIITREAVWELPAEEKITSDTSTTSSNGANSTGAAVVTTNAAINNINVDSSATQNGGIPIINGGASTTTTTTTADDHSPSLLTIAERNEKRAEFKRQVSDFVSKQMQPYRKRFFVDANDFVQFLRKITHKVLDNQDKSNQELRFTESVRVSTKRLVDEYIRMFKSSRVTLCTSTINSSQLNRSVSSSSNASAKHYHHHHHHHRSSLSSSTTASNSKASSTLGDEDAEGSNSDCTPVREESQQSSSSSCTSYAAAVVVAETTSLL